MKAMVLKAANTPFVLETVPDPVPGPGETVAVFGAGGGLGIHMVMLARWAGAKVIGALELLASGEIWPMVNDIRKLEEAEALHRRIENGEVIGRAALLIA